MIINILNKNMIDSIIILNDHLTLLLSFIT